MKTYTTRSNAKRAAQSLAKKFSFIAEAGSIPSDSNEAFLPHVKVNCLRAAVPAELFDVAVVDPVDADAWALELQQIEVAMNASVGAVEETDPAAIEEAIAESQSADTDPALYPAPEEDIEADNRREVVYNEAGDPVDPLVQQKFDEMKAEDQAKANEEDRVVVPDGIIHKSQIENPCRVVWEIAGRMLAENPSVKRKDVLAACTAAGIAYYTARTQYQSYLTAVKAMNNAAAAKK